MATIALIQNLFSVLNVPEAARVTGFSKQLYEKFFEILVDESGHDIQRAESLEAYQAEKHPKPDMVICAPFPEIGNLAPGFAELQRFRDAFPETPLVVWANRDEDALRERVIEDFGVVAFYTGTLLDAGDDFADMVLDHAV